MLIIATLFILITVSLAFATKFIKKTTYRKETTYKAPYILINSVLSLSLLFLGLSLFLI